MPDMEAEFTKDEFKYLNLLAKQYPNISSASTEIINLQAILNLPKGTEHFISDIHGEYEAFSHVLRNASGVIKNHITYILGTSLRDSEKKTLATLIYYPEQKLEEIKKTEKDLDDWYRITLHRLVTICKAISSKYTRSKVRKALPPDFSYIIEELLHEDSTGEDKELYYNQIIESIIRLDQADRFITAISKLIQRLAIDRLHVIGDIYDRGPRAAKIMDILDNYHSVDIQWGNHDISWMGAAAGCQALICNVIRIQARYCNLDTIEEDYGINLIPLATFAMEKYADDPCTYFMPKNSEADALSDKEVQLTAKMHKAISVMQFKMEAQIIKRHPEFKMDERLLLDKIDCEKGTITLKGRQYQLRDTNLPTIDPDNPFELSDEEQDVMDKIKSSFVNSGRLQKHVRFMFSTKRECLDLIWYLWCGENSPLFGKDAMTTFERYFVDDTSTHKENKSPYYERRNDEKVCRGILDNFGLDPDKSHIINGHVPVQVRKGESPIKANGKLFVIDGGFAKAYQKETGIAGYTLIYNSHGLVLVSHEPFESREKAIAEEKDIHSSTVALQYSQARIRVISTDIGKEIKKNIEELEKLMDAYRSGLIKEIK